MSFLDKAGYWRWISFVVSLLLCALAWRMSYSYLTLERDIDPSLMRVHPVMFPTGFGITIQVLVGVCSLITRKLSSLYTIIPSAFLCGYWICLLATVLLYMYDSGSTLSGAK
jgi:hypothetical protein